MDALNWQEAQQKESVRFHDYRRWLGFYSGRQWPAGAHGKQLTFNYAQLVVDKLTSYLINGLKVNVVAENDSIAARAAAALDEVEAGSGLEQLNFDTELDCAVLGDGVYKLTWDDEQGVVRVTAPDVQGLFAWWRADDMSRVWRVAVSYRLEAGETEYSTGFKCPAPTTVSEVWTDNTFELWCGGEVTVRKENPYGFIPFIIFPNLRRPKQFWGLSDIPQLIEPQCELNRALSQLGGILELSGNPVAVLENVEQAEDIAVRPGAVWHLPEEARAYLLDLLQGGGVNLHLGYIELIYRTMHDIAESPRAAYGGTGRDMSGVALEIELQPLLQKLWRKRLIRTPVYRRRAEMILKLLTRCRGDNFDGARVCVHWNPVLPRDLAAAAASQEVLVRTGIHSRRRAMAEMGVADPEGELVRWLAEEGQLAALKQEMKLKEETWKK